MSEILKRKFNVGIGKEAVRGTAVVPAVWLKPTSEEYNDKVDVVATERAMGVIEDSDDQVVVGQMSEGTIEGEMFDQSFGYLLLGALGQVNSVVSADSGVYNHTFSVLQSALHPTFTLEIKRGTIEQLAFTNTVIDNLKINAEVKKYVEFSVDLKGKKGTPATDTPAYTEENYFLAKSIAVQIADNYSGLSSAVAIDVKKIELEIAKNIEPKEVLSQDGPSDFLNKELAIEGSLEMNFADTVMRDYVLNNTQKAIRIEIKNTDVTIGTSSNPSLVIDLAKVKFSEGTIGGGNNDLAKIDIKFKAFYSLSDALSVQAVLTNTQTSY